MYFFVCFLNFSCLLLSHLFIKTIRLQNIIALNHAQTCLFHEQHLPTLWVFSAYAAAQQLIPVQHTGISVVSK